MAAHGQSRSASESANAEAFPLTRRAFLAVTVAAYTALHVRTARGAGGGPSWSSHGFGPEQTRHNPGENILSPESVGALRQMWAFEAGSGVTGTPVVTGERVVFGSWDGNVYAVERRSGKLVWQHEVGTRAYPPDRRLGIYASVAASGPAVFVAADRLLALGFDDGRLLWERTIGDPATTLEYFWAAPLVHERRLYAGVSAGSETRTRGRIVSVDAETGELRWTFFTADENTAGAALVAPPSVDPASGTLYAVTGNPFHLAPDSAEHGVSLLALDSATGELRWSDQIHPRDTRNLDLNCPPMLITLRTGARGVRLVVAGGKDGLRAWDRDRRVRLWRAQLTPAMPAGGTEALPTSGPEGGPTAAADGLVFFASNNHPSEGCLLAAYEAASGELRWLRPLPAFQFGPPSVANGVVYIGLVDGKLRAFRASDGEPLWESPADQPIAGGPAIAGGMVFVGTGAGSFLPGNRLLAFGLREAT